MPDPWYWKIREAFKRHQEEEHADKGWHVIQDEVRFFQEELFYGSREDGEESEWGCCWVGCKWRIKFETITILTWHKEVQE